MPAIPAITEANGSTKVRGNRSNVPPTPWRRAAQGAPHLGELDPLPGWPTTCAAWGGSRGAGRSRLPPSLDLVLALLAVLAQGALPAARPRSYPAERLRFMAEDARAPVMSPQEPFRVASPGRTWRSPPAPTPGRRPLRGRAAAARRGWCARPAAPPNVIYTSGSTGRPRGSSSPIGRVLRLLAATAPWFRLHGGRRLDLSSTPTPSISRSGSCGERSSNRARLLRVPRWLARAPRRLPGAPRPRGGGRCQPDALRLYALIEADRAADAGAAESLRGGRLRRRGARSRTAGALVARHGEADESGQHVRDHRETVHRHPDRPLVRLGSRATGRQPDRRADSRPRHPRVDAPSSRRIGGGPASSPSAAPASRAAPRPPELTAVRFCPDPGAADPVHASTARVTWCAAGRAGELRTWARIDPAGSRCAGCSLRRA